MKSCFIIMPISTPRDSVEVYNGDVEHFSHVLECLFIPAIEVCGLQAIPPIVAGSEIIHGEIIKNLSSADLVLCDISQLRANVFFEFGIRTALNKPVALVTDDTTTKNIPFDTGIINYHEYKSSLHGWLIKDEIERLSEHINKTLASEPERNSLWKYFGIAQSGFLSTEQPTPDDKLSLLLQEMEAMRNALHSFLDKSDSEVEDDSPTHASAKENSEPVSGRGRSRRNKPRQLSNKLLAIRKRLQMSQTAMARALDLPHYSAVSNFELGTREPDLVVVLRYARLAGVPAEVLVDDRLKLPE